MRNLRLCLALTVLAAAFLATAPVHAGTLPNGASDLLYRGEPVILCYTSLPPMCIINGVLTVVPFNPQIIPLGADERDIFTASFSFDVASAPLGITLGPHSLTGNPAQGVDILTPGFLGGPGPYFNTEMLALTLSDPQIMIRESPTQQSLGQSPISTSAGPGGNFTIPSFFDVFTEISLDGGSTWAPSTVPYHVTLDTPEPGTWLLAATALSGLWLRRRRR